MINKNIEIKVLAPHVLHVTFRDGFSAVHDFARLKNERSNVAAPLADPDYFARVFLEYGALTWPNGFDMCPDPLRMEIERNGVVKSHVAAE
jgi:Protein of unknown function (DUF2442)